MRSSNCQDHMATKRTQAFCLVIPWTLPDCSSCKTLHFLKIPWWGQVLVRNTDSEALTSNPIDPLSLSGTLELALNKYPRGVSRSYLKKASFTLSILEQTPSVQQVCLCPRPMLAHKNQPQTFTPVSCLKFPAYPGPMAVTLRTCHSALVHSCCGPLLSANLFDGCFWVLCPSFPPPLG